MNSAHLLFKAQIYSRCLRVLSVDDKILFAAEDLANILEYRSTDGVRMAYSRNRRTLKAHSIKAKIDGEGWAIRLFDEFGVRYLCEYSKRPGAVHMLRWLDAGGMQAIPSTVTDSAPVAANVLAFKSPCMTPPVNQDERQKAYCRELLKTLLRYSTALEAEDLTHIIEAEVVNLISRRHCPGLNDARYEVFRRYFLQGGDV